MNQISAAESHEDTALTAGGTSQPLGAARHPHGGRHGSNLAGLGPMGGPAQ